MFFKCSACLAKDNHIADLKAQIARLESRVFPQTGGALPPDADDFTRVASGGDYVNPPPMSAEELEAHLILTGSWEDTAE